MLTEAQAAGVISEALEIGEKRWRQRLRVAEAAYRHTHNGRAMPENILAALIHSYNNTFEAMQEAGHIKRGTPIHEDTFSSDVSPHVPFAFDVITALLPNLIIDEIASIQPMDRRTGEIYFLDYKRSITKGKHTAGETALSALTGANTGTEYDGEYSTDDVTETIGTGTGSEDNFPDTLGQVPIVAGSVVISDGTQEVTDDGEGGLIGDGSGTVDYVTGAIDVTFDSNVASGADVEVTYQVDQERNPDAVGIIDLELRSDTVRARRHALRARWMMDAEYDLMKAHGRNAGDELLAVVVSEIKRDIEIRYLNMLWAQGTGTARSFDAQPPTIGITKFDHYRTFKVELSAAGNRMMQDTQRASGNFIVIGTDVATMIESLGEPDFKPSVDLMNPPAGPHMVGIFGGRWRVIKNPAPEWNGRCLVGHKGEGYLNAGSVWAPYRPVVITPKIVLDDFKNRQGVLSYSAQKMINAKMFTKITCTNTP
jgi:hypothetical protein